MADNAANSADTELDEIVVTAEQQSKQALGYSKISREDLENHPVANDLSQIIRTMPGVNLTNGGNSGQRGNPIEQWRAAKTAASEAMVRCGATITHHHAVGADHKPWMTAEVGDLGVEVLRAVKNVLDPGGILNPGKLIP